MTKDTIIIEKIYVSDDHKETPGQNGSEILIYSLDEAFAIRQVYECDDKKTLIWIIGSYPFINGMLYRVKALSNTPIGFIDPKLLKKGCVLTRLPTKEEIEYDRFCKLRDEMENK